MNVYNSETLNLVYCLEKTELLCNACIVHPIPELSYLIQSVIQSLKELLL